MYIHEAVEKAVKENGKIIRSSARRPESDIYSEITPTNSYDACLITLNFRYWDFSLFAYLFYSFYAVHSILRSKIGESLKNRLTN